ncbi:tetratricopeptide repeat protein 30 homolog [Scaptodrosophila lebanonensis]|uniref:Tetratricopeptide repeat protein 30 n=1 Tax=Drosophila lebanonensis TaxID=7225 RepID=A0A6J2TSG8_DROLE|nr:tetratricopeptide repeat protein 30 homolog [Scaptodrosophila lebanonensis]
MLHQGIILREGHVTRTIYNLIKDKRFEDVIECIVNFGEAANTRAGLSTLGYCYYHAQKYEEAASCYEQLCQLVPKESRYKFYYAQSLYQAGIFADALRILKQINEHDELKEQCLQLQSAILYSSEDYAGAQSILNQRAGGNADTLNDEGCLLYQADQFDGAVQRFQTSLQVGGFNALVAYNLALTHFRKKERSQAIDYTSEIVERGIRNHPELGIGAQIDTDGSARSVGNPITMAVSGITQALNLKAAIEYQDGNMESARDALLDLPPRAESELDPVTLHNMALTDTQGPVAGLRKLAFLLQLGPPACPKETFANILLICCKHEMYETAADILAEHTDLTYKYLSQYLYELLDALITAQTSAELAEKKLGTLASSLAGKLRSLAAKVQEVRATTDQQALRDALKDYEHALELYLPVVMARAWISWRDDDFLGAEREFRSSAEFCSENPIWRLNAGHVLFMQGDKYKEAAAFYEPIVRQHTDDVMSVSAAVLANLCVSYIMTFQNEEAEELMRKVEKAEELKGNLGKQYHHLCIVNLVVGTLYCAKSNYEFGLSRIAHALEGGSGARLYADTWLHVKRCVLGLLTGMAKQNIILPFQAVQEVLSFLKSCEAYGLFTPANIYSATEQAPAEPLTIGLEARKLRLLLIKLSEYENF